VTPVQYGLLEVLGETDGQSGTVLGERLRLDGATITGLLDRLAEAGFVERRPHPTDRRINAIYLTEKGRAIQQDLDRAMAALTAEVLGRLSPADATHLPAVLAQLSHVETAGGAS
jgi:DNA-binding MarR family transcriptional regulator